MSAKEKFQKSSTFRDAAAVLSSEHLERAIEVAMLTFMENSTHAREPIDGNNMHQQLLGARRFVATLNGLIRTDEGPKVERRDILKPTQ